MLFDSSSRLPYITPQLRNHLKLKTVCTRKISIQTFGNNCSEIILEKVNLRILALNGPIICVTCFVKEISAPLNNQNINLAKENFAHIRKILLVDSNPNNESLSIHNLSEKKSVKNFVTDKMIRPFLPTNFFAWLSENIH